MFCGLQQENLDSSILQKEDGVISQITIPLSPSDLNTVDV